MGIISDMKKRKREMEKKAKRRQKGVVASAAAVGSALGVLGGILFAPKAGKETRDDVKNKAKEVNETIKTKSVEVKGNVSEAKEKINDYLASKKKNNCYIEKIENCSEDVCEMEECDEVEVSETEIEEKIEE